MSQIIISDEVLHWKEGAHFFAEEVIRPTAKHYDAKLGTIGDGTSETQQLVISRHILEEVT